MKTISLRRFRDVIRDLNEATEVGLRDGEGNFQILGFWTPYATIGPDAVALPPSNGELREATVEVHTADGRVIPPLVLTTEEGPRIIRTPEEAAKAVQPIRPFTKSDQAGRKKK